ncbi:MAG: ABC transporter permease [Chloroflexi bacterium]|nr:ABC transporter permease [Chloroflexota bacterium]
MSASTLPATSPGQPGALALLAQSYGCWANVSYRTFSVLRRNWDTYISRWRSEVWPPFVEGLLQLAAFGLGVGSYVQTIDGTTYLQFIAPAIVGVTVMFQSAFETSYGSFVRMELQRTFEAIVATPVSVEDVISAELLWGAIRSFLGGLVILLIIAAAGLVQSWWALLMPIAILLEGLAFSCIGMIFTSLAPEFGFFNYLATLVVTPMMLFSGVFFPVSRLPQAIQGVVWFLPLDHAVNLERALALGRIQPGLIVDGLWLMAFVGITATICLVLMRRRLVK